MEDKAMTTDVNTPEKGGSEELASQDAHLPQSCQLINVDLYPGYSTSSKRKLGSSPPCTEVKRSKQEADPECLLEPNIDQGLVQVIEDGIISETSGTPGYTCDTFSSHLGELISTKSSTITNVQFSISQCHDEEANLLIKDTTKNEVLHLPEGETFIDINTGEKPTPTDTECHLPSHKEVQSNCSIEQPQVIAEPSADEVPTSSLSFIIEPPQIHVGSILIPKSDCQVQQESKDSSDEELVQEPHKCPYIETKVDVPGSQISGVHSKSNLLKLIEQAKDYLNEKGATFEHCAEFYRDKSSEYYEDILQHHSGIMQVYSKDNHGDPKSPINCRLNGLFFTLNPQSGSIYGSRRLLVPSEKILQLCPNVYFTDFYCSSLKRRRSSTSPRSHYVTLVLTKPGSEADNFCSTHLIELDLVSNPFFRVDGSSTKVAGTDGRSLWIEALVTEDIDIPDSLNTGANWKNVFNRGRRTGGRQGLPKTHNCDICNI